MRSLKVTGEVSCTRAMSLTAMHLHVARGVVVMKWATIRSSPGLSARGRRRWCSAARNRQTVAGSWGQKPRVFETVPRFHG